MSKDSLGDRMKSAYENRFRFLLPRRSYVMIRLDGRSFHSYTKGCDRPFDLNLMADMDATALKLCEQISGARLAYVQSDEISILVTDFDDITTEMWFDGNIQKWVSISSSIATAEFNRLRLLRNEVVIPKTLAHFDSRVFLLPDPTEVSNMFLWRQQDATRNSISMSAQANFPHKRLQGLSSEKMQEILLQEKDINWNNYPEGFKRGRCVVRIRKVSDVTYTDKRTGAVLTKEGVERNVWEIVDPPVFTQDRDWLLAKIPSRE